MEAPGFYKDVYHEYMIIDRVVGGEAESAFEEQLLHNKKIDRLLSMKLEYVSGCCKYYYNVQRMDSLEGIKEDKKLGCDYISAMFKDMKRLVEQLPDYLLVPDNLWLEPVCIYRSRDNGHYFFTYVPGFKSDFKEQLKELLSWLMKEIDHKQKDTVMLVYGLYKLISEEKTIASFMEKIDTAAESFSEEIKNSGSRSQEYREEIPSAKFETSEKENVREPVFVVEDHFSEEKETEDEADLLPLLVPLLGAAAVGVSGFFLKSSLSCLIFRILGINVSPWVILAVFLAASAVMAVFGIKKLTIYKKRHKSDEFWQESQRPDYSSMAYKETVVLNEAKGKTAETMNLKENLLMLKRVGNIGGFEQDIIYVTCVPFVIGKEYGLVQYRLGENVVSRRHAEIKKENGQYVITDLFSTNGTRLNHEKIKPGTACVLHNEDIVEFANIAFEVKIKENRG